MPFTTYHLAMGLLVGLALRRYLNWAALIITTTVVVDLELVATRGHVVHGPAHTLLAAAAGGASAGLTLYFFRGLVRRLSSAFCLEGSESLGGYVLGGIAGWALHVLADAALYPEMSPLWPLAGNPLLAAEAAGPAYDAVLSTGFAAYAAYLYRAYGGGPPGRSAAGLALAGAAYSVSLASFTGTCLALVPMALLGVYLFYSAIWSARRDVLTIPATAAAVSSYLAYAPVMPACVGVEYALSVVGQLHLLVSLLLLAAAFGLSWPALRGLGRGVRPWLYLLAAGLATAPLLIGLLALSAAYLGLLARVPRALAALTANSDGGRAARPEAPSPTAPWG